MRTTAPHSGEQWTTNKSPHATSGAPYAQSDAPTKNHPSDHTDAANAYPAKKGTPMPSMYNLEKSVESILIQLEVICKKLGIEPLPAPTDENYNPETIQEQLNPDA